MALWCCRWVHLVPSDDLWVWQSGCPVFPSSFLNLSFLLLLLSQLSMQGGNPSLLGSQECWFQASLDLHCLLLLEGGTVKTFLRPTLLLLLNVNILHCFATFSRGRLEMFLNFSFLLNFGIFKFSFFCLQSKILGIVFRNPQKNVNKSLCSAAKIVSGKHSPGFVLAKMRWTPRGGFSQ